jgi:hypothetical protein
VRRTWWKMAIDELAIADLDGRLTEARFGSRPARSRKRLLRVSRWARSITMCVARRSVVLARRFGLRLLLLLIVVDAGAWTSPDVWVAIDI